MAEEDDCNAGGNGGDGIDYRHHFDHEEYFNSLDEATNWVKKVAVNLGFFLVIASHKSLRDGRSAIYIHCDRWRQVVERDLENAIRRNTKRKATRCPFKLKIVQHRDRDHWFVVTFENAAFHNHPLMVYAEGHRQLSSLTPPAKNLVRQMTDAGSRPQQILAAVRLQFTDISPNIDHIYNCREALKREKMEGRNVAQQFVFEATRLQYLFWVQSDETNTITTSFVAHPTSVSLLRTYPWVTLMDSTYKTNIDED